MTAVPLEYSPLKNGERKSDYFFTSWSAILPRLLVVFFVFTKDQTRAFNEYFCGGPERFLLLLQIEGARGKCLDLI